MHFVISPDNLLFFCSVTASVTAVFGLFSLYKRLARHEQRHQPSSIPAGVSEEEEALTAASSLLPPFMYNRLVRHSGKDNMKASTECAICLGMIQVGDMVKLLPACTHIDLWLASHSTCPLCRFRVSDHSAAIQKTAHVSFA
ncbi:RING-H2 finger protein ATL73-like [Brachypodium distachyon]|uniref:RING-type domain-containing protein n=1 Tax=Brachypodium distachyon TaxID=15368 RepID=I1HJS7_BRADI|nr:RING-H2 finger protein ATL73-like [Brachypodium distachyon]KQK06449.1 hypothetical protein BRADI_2g26403v3 [Brachypodium distachyon]|eukprot:XP_024314383.1 RING-H2 finger protein ATL73-like [Brachypodium distachyon]